MPLPFVTGIGNTDCYTSFFRLHHSRIELVALSQGHCSKNSGPFPTISNILDAIFENLELCYVPACSVNFHYSLFFNCHNLLHFTCHHFVFFNYHNFLYFKLHHLFFLKFHHSFCFKLICSLLFRPCRFLYLTFHDSLGSYMPFYLFVESFPISNLNISFHALQL